MSELPKHGQERNRTTSREMTKQQFETADGKPFEIDYCHNEFSIAEKYCSNCREWVSTKPMGILGFVWCPKCMGEW